MFGQAQLIGWYMFLQKKRNLLSSLVLGLLVGSFALPALADAPDFVKNTTPSALGIGSGMASPASVTNLGEVFVTVAPSATSLGKAEDAAHVSGDTGVAGLSVRRDTAATSSGTTADYSTINSDSDGRVYVNSFGAGVGEFWQSCSSSNTGTSDVAIKAAVASNRMYITSISCFNTAAVSSSIAFKDGSTQIYVGGVGNSTLQGVAYWEHTLPTPLRGSVNTAFNFAMGTTATATTCCAAGFISTN